MLEIGAILHTQCVSPEEALSGDHACHRSESTISSRHSGQRLINFCSNDYLDLARHPHVLDAAKQAVDTFGAGATSSRLVSGTLTLHERLENRLAAYKHTPAALVFGSGYLANLGAVTALAGHRDTVFADRLIHASLIDAVKLSGAALKRFRHNDPGHLDELLKRSPDNGRRLVITESVFSMDGDIAPLDDISETARRHGALFMVDEAHSCGISHPTRSLAARPDIIMGTLSKGFGSYGGFIACSTAMRDWLINKARSFIYTTALPPACLGAALGALDVLKDNPGMGDQLLHNARGFRDRLRRGGLDTAGSATQIIPVMIGDNHTTLALAATLRQRNIYCVAIRPPTVPEGTARLRVSVSLGHSVSDLDIAADAMIAAVRPLDMHSQK
ncbi:MAG: 8-amino-7-oxononanoate synthase [Lentisphaeria bacterium]|nr:8-amino-7-oxononanoate synthase [Lentisphaeria bacterium]